MKSLDNPSRDSAPKILSIEQFSSVDDHGLLKSNNFVVYFRPTERTFKFYKDQPHFVRFMKEKPDLYSAICEKVKKAKDAKITTHPKDYLQSCMKDFYKAYKIMRDYGATDKELFT